MFKRIGSWIKSWTWGRLANIGKKILIQIFIAILLEIREVIEENLDKNKVLDIIDDKIKSL